MREWFCPAPSPQYPSFPDEVKSAKLAGLRYIVPRGRGITRKRAFRPSVVMCAVANNIVMPGIPKGPRPYKVRRNARLRAPSTPYPPHCRARSIRKGLPKRKVLAAVVKLLETTYIRIGNEEYAEENGCFGRANFAEQACAGSGRHAQVQVQRQEWSAPRDHSRR